MVYLIFLILAIWDKDFPSRTAESWKKEQILVNIPVDEMTTVDKSYRTTIYL